MANIAEQIVDMLVKAGVKRIYAVTGDSLNKINDAVRKDGRIQWIHVRHEETGAFAAGAEAQLHGNLACCAGSGGPGQTEYVFGHGGIQLMLYHPETRNDQDQDDQPAVRTYF